VIDNKLFEVVVDNILNGKVKTECLQLAVVLYDRKLLDQVSLYVPLEEKNLGFF
jgi:hypothetical protein